MNTATRPFQFVTASYLVCVENQKADTAAQLLDALASARDEAIFYHTFQSLGRYHFITEGFSNDFAQWTLASLNQPVLAERLASIDIRDYVSIAELRADIQRMIAEYVDGHAEKANLSAFEPFYFCRTAEVTVPLPWDAKTLAGIRAGLERLSHASFYHHFIASRLRLQLRTNDFSHWFRTELGLERLADRADQIDIYTNTLDTARHELIELVNEETHT